MAYNGQARIAFETGFNDALFGRPNANPYDISVVGESYQAYEEGYAAGLISDVPPRGPKGDTGDTGATGAQGPAGADGADGAAGGITQLTGHVVAGPGTGSQATTVQPAMITDQAFAAALTGPETAIIVQGGVLRETSFDQMSDWFQSDLNIPTDHTALTSIGVNTHAQIDTHIADMANPHTVALSQLDEVTITAPALNEVIYFDGADWVNISAAILGGSNNLDGGASDTNYGGTVGIDGGDST